MNYYTIKFLITSVIALLILSGCEEDDSIFSGTDNFITAFGLEKDGTVYTAAIYQDSILIRRPANVSFKDAISKVILSENATISPQPESITNWDEQQTFIVHSHNSKTEKTYTYMVKTIAVSSEGSVVLHAQEEVEAFAEKGITTIAGDLIIGKETGEVAEDSITSLAPLAGIEVVKGNIIIHPTYAGKDISGLEDITKANSLSILKSGTIEKIDMPNLSLLGENLNITCEKVENISFPQLTGLGGSVTITSSQVPNTVKMSLLETIGANITLSGLIQIVEMPQLSTMGQALSLSNLQDLEEVSFPKLSHAQSVNISNLPKAKHINLNKLETCSERFTISNMAILEKIEISSLVEVSNMFYLQNLPLLAQINASALRTVSGAFNLSILSSLVDLKSFSSLASLGSTVTLSGLAIKNFEGLEALETIEGSLQITNNPSLTSLKGFDALSKIELDLQIYGSPELTVLNGFPQLQSVRNVTINQLTTLQEIGDIFTSLNTVQNITFNNCRALRTIKFHEHLKNTPIAQLSLDYLDEVTVSLEGMKIDIVKLQAIDVKATLKGSAYFDGNIELRMIKEIEIDGISEVKGFKISTNGTSTDMLNIPSIRKVRDSFGYEISYGSSVPVNFPELEEIGGEFTLNGYASAQAIHPLFPSLKKVGTFNYTGGPLKKLTFPALEIVENDMLISTFWDANSQIEMIEMPSLQRVGGVLSIFSSATSSDRFNSKLIHLDGFSSLIHAGSVSITRQKSLTSFEGLTDVVPNLSASTWSVSDNAYNPSYEDVKAGQLVKP